MEDADIVVEEYNSEEETAREDKRWEVEGRWVFRLLILLLSVCVCACVLSSDSEEELEEDHTRKVSG